MKSCSVCWLWRTVPTSVRILFISSFFLWALEARFCFSIHLLSSRLQKRKEKKKNPLKLEHATWNVVPYSGRLWYTVTYHSAFSFSSSSKYENSLHESKLYLKKRTLFFYHFKSTSFASKWPKKFYHLPKGVKIIHFLKGWLHGSELRYMLFGRPSCISLKNGGKHFKKVFLAFALRRHGVVEGWIYTVKGSSLHRVRQDFYSWGWNSDRRRK